MTRPKGSVLNAGRTLLFALLASAPVDAIAASIAVPPASAPAKSGGDKLEKQVRAQLAAEGHEVIAEKALERAAKKAGTSASSVEAARAAGADLLVVISIKKQKKAFSVTAELIHVADDRVLETSKKTYKKAASASAIGDVIGRELAEGVGRADLSKAVEPEEERPAKVLQPKDEAPARAAPADGVTPKDEAPAGAAAAAPKAKAAPGGGEGKLMQLFVGGGTQMASAYTVAVGEQVTGLAYDLSPLVLFEAGARLNIPGTGLGIELGLSFVPVKYNIEVEPAVDPAEPKGSFLNVGGAVSYRLDLADLGGGDAVYLSPLVGVSYEGLSVESQAPYAVVISSSQIAPAIGTRFGLGLGDLVLEAKLALELVVSYSESPDKTGEDGGGIGLLLGAGLRYWVSENFGVFMDLAYDYTRITFNGEATRTPFIEDPKIENATVFSGNLKTALGVAVAL